jgi:hypothetical protein
MIRRPHRVTIRLTEQELQWLRELKGYLYKWDPSEIIREAIKTLRRQKDADEAKLRQPTPASSDKPAIAARPKKPRRQTAGR